METKGRLTAEKFALELGQYLRRRCEKMYMVAGVFENGDEGFDHVAPFAAGNDKQARVRAREVVRGIKARAAEMRRKSGKPWTYTPLHVYAARTVESFR